MRLVVENLSVRYQHNAQNAATVRDVNLNVAAGQLVVIVGPNGCGKSTLLRAIARLQPPCAGQIFVDGQDVWQLSPRQAAHSIALLPQSPLAPEGITVTDLVRYGRHPHQSWLKQWSAHDQTVVENAMAACNVSDLAEQRLERLSGGQRQRCWLAMILAQAAPLMLLDEPISMLDLGHQIEVLSLAQRLTRQGASIVMVLHDLIAAARYADVLVAMQDGQIVAQGAPRDIVTPALVQSLYGVQADILTAPIDGSPVVVPSALPSAKQLA